MERIQPGHEVISLFGMTPKAQIMSQNPRLLATSLLKAILLVALTALVLSTFARVAVSDSLTTDAAQTVTTIGVAAEEPAAFESGQFVSVHLQRGYLTE
jgi:hypothetical protein